MTRISDDDLPTHEQLENDKLTEEIRKARLEQDKIKCEIRTMTRPWYLQGAYIAALLPIVTIAAGTWITYTNSEYKRDADQAKQQLSTLQPQITLLKAERDRLRSETKQLTENRDELSKQVDAISKSLADREITNGQRQILLPTLRKHKAVVAAVWGVGSNLETYRYARKVKNLLHESGWTVKKANVDLIPVSASIMFQEITLWVKNAQTPPPAATALKSAFTAAGITANIRSDDVSAKSDEVNVYVGEK